MRFEVYKAVSLQIRAIFAEHTPIIELLSLDEACLDVTENLMGLPLATDIAKAIGSHSPGSLRLTSLSTSGLGAAQREPSSASTACTRLFEAEDRSFA